MKRGDSAREREEERMEEYRRKSEVEEEGKRRGEVSVKWWRDQ